VPSAAVDDDSVRLLLEKVAADTTLSTSERNAAKRMRSSADRPELVLERIQRRAMEFLPRLPRALPQNDLARVVQAATFLRHHSKPFVNQAFNTADDFATAVGKSLDGSLLLHVGRMLDTQISRVLDRASLGPGGGRAERASSPAFRLVIQ